MIYHFGYLEQFHSTLSHYIQRMRILFNSQKTQLGSMKHRHFRLKACLFFFWAFTTWLIWFGGPVLTSSGSSSLPIAIAEDRTMIIPTKFSVNHDRTNWWLVLKACLTTQHQCILSNYYRSHVRCSCLCLCQCFIDYDSHAKSSNLV
jgi:hypothetical protein